MIRPWVHFPEYNIALAFMPKVANTSMKMAFAELKGMTQFSKSQIGIHSHFRGMSPQDISVFDCPKFIFVRNPFDRLVSAWQSKLIDKEKHPSWDQYGMYHGMPFKEFAERVCEIPDEQSDHHFRSQTFEMKHNGQYLNDLKVRQFEYLGTGWLDIQALIPGLPDLNVWGASHKEDYKLYYSEALINLVSVRYKGDLQKFNYSFE